MRFYNFAAYLESSDGRTLENGMVFSPSEENARIFIMESFLKRWLERGYSLKMLSINDKTEFISNMLQQYNFSNN